MWFCDFPQKHWKLSSSFGCNFHYQYLIFKIACLLSLYSFFIKVRLVNILWKYVCSFLRLLKNAKASQRGRLLMLPSICTIRNMIFVYNIKTNINLYYSCLVHRNNKWVFTWQASLQVKLNFSWLCDRRVVFNT